jgi:predicted metalloprotease with PDZ domain
MQLNIKFLRLALAACFAFPFCSYAQTVSKYAIANKVAITPANPVIRYTITIEPGKPSSIGVQMHIENIGPKFSIAMFAHPEYDDAYWRYVSDIKAISEHGTASLVRKDSALWEVTTSGQEIDIWYTLQLPSEQKPRAAWRPFVSAECALISQTHLLMYIVGATKTPCYLQLKLPDAWQAVTSLQPLKDSLHFFAPTAAALMDAPILVGHLSKQLFYVNNIPHHVAYGPSSNVSLFKHQKLVDGIKRLVQQAAILFGGLPYREYFFLLQDSAYGALEHANSVTLGTPAADLQKSMDSYFIEIAHEYFHAWNLVRIRPSEYGDIDYKKQALSKGLWWGEGITMYYADLLLRRAGLPAEEASRTEHLKNLLSRYYSNPGNYKFSAEEISMASYGSPDMLDDYTASAHLQGELLGTMLDLIIKKAAGNKKSLDDVLRKMMKKFSSKGFTSKDIERIITATCGCDVSSFFNDHVRGAKPIAFNNYLAWIGLQADTTWKVALNEDGTEQADMRVFAWLMPDKKTVALKVLNPESCWGKAGLHTGDIILSVKGLAVVTPRDFHRVVRNVKPGEVMPMEIKKGDSIVKIIVTVTGYKNADVEITEIKNATFQQKQLLKAWKEAK